ERKDRVEVVGEVKDAMYYDLRGTVPAMIYSPYLQQYHARQKEADAEKGVLRGMNSLEVRAVGNTAALPEAIRSEIHSIDPSLSIDSVEPLGALFDESLVEDRAVAALSSLFGVLALALAGIGLYGVMSYSVNRRTAEIGVRLALGARPGRVQWLILRETLVLVAAGTIGGLIAALSLTGLVSSLLFGLSPTDPAAIILATVILVAASGLAGFLPARRASRVDPMAALRCE